MDNIDEVIDVKAVKESQQKVYRCSTCSFQTRHSSGLSHHKRVHLAPEERQLFPCAQCNNKYMSEKALECHLDNNHIDSRAKESQKKVYKCAICSFQTRHISNLRKHKNVHLALEERQLFACTHCDKKYTSKQTLKYHLEDNHIDSRTKKSQRNVFSCAICIFQTQHKSHFNQHMKVHLAPEERQFFACAHCDKKYASKQTLRFHLEDNHIDTRMHESQKNYYRCSTCNYQARDLPKLRRHEKVHLALEERQLFACAHCDKKYTTKQKLKEHLQYVHINSRNIVYRCDTCHYQTQRKSHFKQHKQIHWAPEERQLFACTHCKSKYMTKSSLQGHLKRVHDSRNTDCISSTDEVVLDSLKIEIDDHAPLTDDFRNAECLLATNEVKSEDFFKIEPDNVAPVLDNVR